VEEEPATAVEFVLTPADLALFPGELPTELRQAAMSGQGDLVLEPIERIELGHVGLTAGQAKHRMALAISFSAGPFTSGRESRLPAAW
jgi:hypothetical protein